MQEYSPDPAKPTAVICAPLLILLLAAIPCFAQDESANPADTPTGLVFRWINFLIVFGGMGYLIAKYGGGFFRANAKAIAASIHEAAATKAEAERELRDIEAKIAGLDREIAGLRDAARRDSAAEAERLKASGLVEIEKIRQAAAAERAASERAARRQLRELGATLAVQRAAALLGSRMNTEVRARIFQSFLGGLNGSSN